MMLVYAAETEACDGFELADASSERRRGRRIRQARPVRVYDAAAGARYFGGVTEDISATGLRIELPAAAQLRPGKILAVHVGLNEGGATLANRRQMIPAKVVWVDAGASIGHVVAGVEFLSSISAHLDAA